MLSFGFGARRFALPFARRLDGLRTLDVVTALRALSRIGTSARPSEPASASDFFRELETLR
jgi:hypothetical protein